MAFLGIFGQDENTEGLENTGVLIPDASEEASQLIPDATDAELNALQGVSIPDAEEELSSGDERSVMQSVVEGGKAGAKEALVPFSMSPEERKKALGDSKAAMVSYLLSNIGTGIAAGAAAGAAAGSVVPGAGTALGGAAGGVLGGAKTAATIGSALYAMYAGLGRDRLRSMEDGEEWKPLSGKGLATAALTIGTELNPIIKASSKPAALIRAAAQPLAEGAVEAIHGGSKQDVALASAFGLIGAAAVAHNVAGKGDYSKRLVENVADNIDNVLPDESRGWVDKALEAVKKEDITLPKSFEEIPDGFKRYLVGDVRGALDSDKLNKAFTEASARLSPEKIQDTYAVFKTQNALTKIVEEDTAKLNSGLKTAGTIKDITKADEWLNPTLYVSKAIDKATGLETMKLYDKMNQTRHAYSQVANTFSRRLYNTRRMADKLGLSGEDVFDLVERRPNASVSKAIAKYGEANVNTLRDSVVKQTDDMLGFLKELGYNPLRRDGYMPHKTKRAAELAAEIDDASKELEREMAAHGVDTLASLRSKGSETLKTMDALATRRLGHQIENGGDLAQLKSILLSSAPPPSSIQDIENEAAALFSRRGDVPGRLQERNAWELLSGYVNENVRAAMYDDALRYGQTMIKALDTAGLKRASNFFTRYMSDNMGGRWGLDGALKNLATQMEYRGTRMLRDAQDSIFGKAAGAAVKGAPEFASWLNNQIYPAKLAFNIPGTIRNYTQFIMSTVPEVGNVYGGKVAFKAAVESLKDPARMKQNLKKLNLASDFFRGELENKASALGHVRHGVEKFNEYAMKLYSSSDTMNRMVSYNMGQQIAKDLMRGNPDAIKFLNKADPTLKAGIRRALREGAGTSVAENVGDMIGRYLISKTQFDFGRAAQSQFQRGAGPLLSMFTTWPTNIAADSVNIFRDKGARKGAAEFARKYMAAYGLLAGASAALSERSNPMTQYLIGKPEEYAPLASILPKESQGRSFLSNPLLDTATGVAGAAVKGDVKGVARKTADAALKSYLPVVSPVVNELDKYSRIVKGQKMTDRLYEKMGIGRD